MSYFYDRFEYESNPIHEAERQESRDARRSAPTHRTPGDCNHVGGITRGNRECTICGEGPA